jgi:hypothetical protein
MTQPYQRFARHYHEGHYTQFARWVSETVFPTSSKRFLFNRSPCWT